MRTALLTALALTALATTGVVAQTPVQPGAQAPNGEAAGGCPCCKKMAKKSDHGAMHSAPSGPTDKPRQ